jgi:NAD(P)-dependent dehydrogenase (short-subunit alcohol dehydrogenase family)
MDLKDRGIRVNAISPGPIETPAIGNLAKTEEERQGLTAQLTSMVPLGRMGQPDEIAKAAVFLASDDASYIAGIELFVDGGSAQV